MTAPAWIKAFCSTGNSRTNLSAPITHRRGECVYTVATNGHRLIAIPGEHGFPAAATTLIAGFDRALELPLRAPSRLDLPAFRAFLAEHVPIREDCSTCGARGSVECSTCDGEGEADCICKCGHEHESTCAACDGSGKTPCSACKQGHEDRIVVQIGARFFDARLLARPIEALEGNVAALYEAPIAGSPCLRIDGPAGLLVVMGLNDFMGAKSVGRFSIEESMPHEARP